MKTLQILQYVAALLAMGAMVAASALGWDMSAELYGMLGAVAGLMLKRPSDSTAVQKVMPAKE